MSSIVFRADASVHIGYGHVMRCLTLADEIKTKNWKTVFICRDLPGNLFTEIENRGHGLIKLHRVENYFNGTIAENDYAAKLGVTWEHDADDTIKAIDSSVFEPRWLVVDHYGIGKKWEKRFRNKVEKILVIDDLAEQPHECDILLNPNFLPDLKDNFRSLVPGTAALLLGPKYALLRHEFLELRKALKPRDGNVRQVLLFYGGVDSTNQTSKALQAIKRLNRPEIQFDVVIGSVNQNRASIERQIYDIPNATLHIQLPHLADLMGHADLALGAAGSATWERLCMGIPTIVTTVAENQLQLTQYLIENDLIIWLGNAKDVDIVDIEKKLNSILEEPEMLSRQSRNCLKLVDGKGIFRIVDKLLSELSSLHLRPV